MTDANRKLLEETKLLAKAWQYERSMREEIEAENARLKHELRVERKTVQALKETFVVLSSVFNQLATRPEAIPQTFHGEVLV